MSSEHNLTDGSWDGVPMSEGFMIDFRPGCGFVITKTDGKAYRIEVHKDGKLVITAPIADRCRKLIFPFVKDEFPTGFAVMLIPTDVSDCVTPTSLSR